MTTPTYETITVEGEGLTISLLVWRRFRQPVAGLIEQILDINPGLSARVFIPVGTKIIVPIPIPRSLDVVTPIKLYE